MKQHATAWELWALALLGIWLKFFRGKSGKPVSGPTATHTGHPAHVLSGVWQSLSGGALSMIHLLGVLLTLGALMGLVVLGVRLFMRRRRVEAMIAEEIVLGPDDVAKPDEMVAALDSIHTALLTRYGGAAVGQVSWAFEIVRDREGQIHFVIAAPHRWLKTIEDNWRSVYTNLRFEPWGDVDRIWPYAQQIVLERNWMHPTRIDTVYQSSVVEMIVQALDRAEGEARLQWLMTPLAVGPLTTQLRGALKQKEYAASAAKQGDPSHPGLGVVERQDVSQATALLGRSAYRAEVRLAADDWDGVQRIYGALASANADNQWKAQTVWTFKRTWSRWFNRRVPSLALFGHVILFSKPLATVIHVPSARLRVQSLHRKLVRRGPAPPTIPRDGHLAILRDEVGTVGIPEGDRKFNTLFIGSQGGGKSTGMLQQIRVDAAYRDRQGRPKSLVLIDIGKDTAKRAMGMIPADREVIWFDPADPNCPWTLNPLMAGVHASSLANDVLEGLTQVFGDDAIRARSREFLGNAILAVKEVHGVNADFSMAYKMLTDATFRQDVIDRVQDPHQKDYWQVTFTQTVANNPRFVEEGLAAPRNKLDEVLRNQAVRAALTSDGHRQLLNLRDVVVGRKVLVANLDKARLGKSGARLLGVFLITMLWHALETQTDVPEADRVPTALVIDEAQNFISEGFLDILAEGRAYGAQTTLAVRFLGEILSERAILGVRTLVQNLVIYQFELREEAEDFMKRFMRTYSNMITPSEEAQDNINFGADDFMRLPKHHVICRWMVDGSPQQAFLAETIPWEPYYDDEVKQLHLSRQPQLVAAEPSSDTVGDDGPDTAEPDVDLADLGLAATPASMPAAGGLTLSPSPDAPEAIASDGDSAPVPTRPPQWLVWLMGTAPVETWWDRASGAGLAPVWDRMQEQSGKGWQWTIEGLPHTNPDWVPEVRARAVRVAHTLVRTEAVLAWVSSDTLGVWTAGEVVLDEAQWIATGEEHNIFWHPAGEAPEPSIRPVSDPPSFDSTASIESDTDPAGLETQSAEPEPEPTPRSRKRRRGDQSQVDMLTQGELWTRWVQKTHVTQDTVRQWQASLKATDEETLSTMRWVLDHHIDVKSVEPIFRSVMQRKIDDRWMKPLCDQLDVSEKSLRDMFSGRSDIKTWARWVKSHPEITSVTQLLAAMRQVDQRQAAGS